MVVILFTVLMLDVFQKICPHSFTRIFDGLLWRYNHFQNYHHPWPTWYTAKYVPEKAMKQRCRFVFPVFGQTILHIVWDSTFTRIFGYGESTENIFEVHGIVTLRFRCHFEMMSSNMYISLLYSLTVRVQQFLSPCALNIVVYHCFMNISTSHIKNIQIIHNRI